MHPDLFVLPLPGPDFQVATYRAAYMLAALVTVALAWLLAVRIGLDRRRSLAVIGACALALPLGARAWHVATHWPTYAEEPYRIWTLQATGHSMFGGILAVAVVGFTLARTLGIDPWRLADAGAPALAAGIAIMRAGCFAAGCCFGLPFDGAWAVTFPAGSGSHLWQMANDVVSFFEGPVAVHPTQLYELAGALFVGLLALAMLASRRIPPGVPFLAFVATFAIVRAAITPFRVGATNPPELGAYAYLYTATVFACVALAIWRFRAAKAGERISGEPAEPQSVNGVPLTLRMKHNLLKRNHRGE